MVSRRRALRMTWTRTRSLTRTTEARAGPRTSSSGSNSRSRARNSRDPAASDLISRPWIVTSARAAKGG